jgi:uncharacterized protein (DUF433 family)
MQDQVLLDRIVLDGAICGGRPTIRGTRIRVSDVLELLAAAVPEDDILADFDELSEDDIRAAILFAARSIGHPVFKVA